MDITINVPGDSAQLAEIAAGPGGGDPGVEIEMEAGQ